MTLSRLGSGDQKKFTVLAAPAEHTTCPFGSLTKKCCIAIEGGRTTAPEILIGAPQNGRVGAKPTDTGEKQAPNCRHREDDAHS